MDPPVGQGTKSPAAVGPLTTPRPSGLPDARPTRRPLADQQPPSRERAVLNVTSVPTRTLRPLRSSESHQVDRRSLASHTTLPVRPHSSRTHPARCPLVIDPSLLRHSARAGSLHGDRPQDLPVNLPRHVNQLENLPSEPSWIDSAGENSRPGWQRRFRRYPLWEDERATVQ